MKKIIVHKKNGNRMCHTQFDPRRFGLLAPLMAPQLLTLRRAARLIDAVRRRRIYDCGDRSDHVFFLQGGVIKIAAPLPRSDRESLLMFVHPGDLFGEHAMMEDRPRDHMAEAHEDSVVWVVARGVIVDIARESAAFSSEVARLMARRARYFQSRIEGLLCRDAYARVASTLQTLAVDHAITDADGLLIPNRLTQTDLANMTGLARETVNGVLVDLRARGVVELSGRTVRIKRPNLLRLIEATSPSVAAHRGDLRVVA
jgi:CRP/FNR family transcriptional regulator, cyclic AMP receptor protein